jgi:hypothetical protein
MEEKIVKLRQGVTCDCGNHHLIPQGGTYLVLDSGRLSCPKHQHDEALLETQLAGALR